MGNICSKSANQPTSSDNFTGPGRRLGGGGGGEGDSSRASGAPAANRTTQPIPSTVQPTSPGRTLGTGIENSEDARAQAARAAQARLDQKKQSGGGKLATQLRASQGQTVNATLNEISRQNQDERRADENATTQAWN